MTDYAMAMLLAEELCFPCFEGVPVDPAAPTRSNSPPTNGKCAENAEITLRANAAIVRQLNGGPMPPRGQEMHALGLKIKAIAEAAYHLGRCDDRTIPQLAKAIGVSSSALTKSIAEGRLSTRIEIALVEIGGFERADPRWFDGSVSPRDKSLSPIAYKGKDSVEAFRRMLRDLHDIPVEARWRAQPQAPQHRNRDFATFAIEGSGQTVEPGEPLVLFFRAVLKPGYHQGLIYGFRRIRLRFIKANGSAMRLSNKLGDGVAAILGPDAELNVWGGDFDPEWFLATKNPMLQGEYATSDPPLCELSGVQPGEEIIAEIAVQQYDGTLRDSKGRELNDRAKSAVLAALCAEQLLEARDAAGWLSLGLQKIKIVRGDA